MKRIRSLIPLAAAAISMGAGAAPAGTPGEGDDTRAYAAELTADAALRSSHLGGDEGGTSVNLGGFGQFRYYMNFRDNPGPTAGGDHDSGFTNGFEATRTRLQATGSIGGKDLTFKIEGEFDGSVDGTSFGLLDAYAAYALGDGSSFIAGQFQLPLYRDWTLSPKGQLAADMSLMTAAINPGYSQGVGYQYRSEGFGLFASFNDGIRAGNTPYTSTSEADWAVLLRAEWKGGGAWEQFDEYTSWRGNPFMWLVGGGVDFQGEGNTASTGTVSQDQQFAFVVDSMLKGNGWNAYGAFLVNSNDSGTGDSLLDMGAMIQAGVFVSDSVELFGRWDILIPDSDRALNVAFNTVTFGGNYYPFVKSNAVKFTCDLQCFLQPTSESDLVTTASSTISFIGLRPSTEENQICVRFQFQWMF